MPHVDEPSDAGGGHEPVVVDPRDRAHRHRHEVFHNQRGRLPAGALRAETSVAIVTLSFHLHE
jgi:hypothetical protein